jgi:hypothetical protein
MRSRAPRAGAPVLVLLFVALAPRPSAAQATPPDIVVPDDPDAVQVVTLRDGSVLNGRVIDPGPPVRFRLSSGAVVELDPATIRDLRITMGRVVDGELWDPDPNPSRLFFAPTGRTTPAGSGYVGVFGLVLPFVSASPADAFQIAAGTPLVGGFDRRPFYLAPKLRVVDRGGVEGALGAWIISTGDAEDVFSLAYGVATIGDPDRSLTLGLGYGVRGTEVVDRPVVVAGGDVRVSRRVKLVTENWVFPDGYGLASFGPRFLGSRLSADLGVGVFFSSGEPDPLLFPMVNFVYAW